MHWSRPVDRRSHFPVLRAVTPPIPDQSPNYFPLRIPMPRTVAVVGAGAAGLVAARQLLREGLDVAVFEKSGRAGGTWAYDPRADADSLSRDPGAPSAVHGSLYASLRTNLTRDLMGFSDFPMASRVFAGDARAFPGHQEVLAFLDAFAEECGVAARVRLRSEVLRVAGAPLGQRGRPSASGSGGRSRGAARTARWRRRCSTPSWSATATVRCPGCPAFEVPAIS
jgi:phytoene dehydrogenase-like protein